MSIIKASNEIKPIIVLSFEVLAFDNSTLSLKQVLCIYHSIRFKKDQVKIKALPDSGSEVNTMTQAYIAKLSFKVQLINIGT